MANGINKVILIGTLGRDPEITTSNNGSTIANLAVATNETWKDKTTGEKKTKTEWHRVSAFGNMADNVGKFLTKGSQIYIEGKLQTRKWQDKSGQDRYTTEIIASVIQFMGGGQSDTQQTTQPKESKPQVQQAQKQQIASDETWDDDIPF